MGWYLDSIRVNPDALARAKSIVAEAVKAAYNTPASRFTCDSCGAPVTRLTCESTCDYCGTRHNTRLVR
jgi:rubrerythrin